MRLDWKGIAIHLAAIHGTNGMMAESSSFKPADQQRILHIMAETTGLLKGMAILPKPAYSLEDVIELLADHATILRIAMAKRVSKSKRNKTK